MGGQEVSHDEHGRVKLSSVELNKFTVLIHRDDVEITNDRADVMEITPQDTLTMTGMFKDSTWELAKQDADFKRRLGLIYPDLDITTDTRHIRQYPIAYQHIVGLIVCTNKAINTGKIPFWRTPECYLHPSTQTRLAELMQSYIKDAEEAQREAERIHTDRSDDRGGNSGDSGSDCDSGVSTVADDPV